MPPRAAFAMPTRCAYTTTAAPACWCASVDDRVQPGVVCAPVGALGQARARKRNVNALTSERLTDAGGGPTFYSCLVQVERSGD